MAMKKSALQLQCEELGLPYTDLTISGSGRAAEIALPHYRREGWRGLYGKGNLTWAVLRALMMPALRQHHAETLDPYAPYHLPLPILLGMMFGTHYATAIPAASKDEISQSLIQSVRDSFKRNPLRLTDDFNIICSAYRAASYQRVPDGLSISELIDCTRLETWEGLLSRLLKTGNYLPAFPQLELINSREFMVVEVARTGSRLRAPAVSALKFLQGLHIRIEVARLHGTRAARRPRPDHLIVDM